VVRRALEYLERLSKVKSPDPVLRRDLAGAFERVALLQSGLFESHVGDTEGALRSLRNALRIREALLAENPGHAPDRRALADTLAQLAQVQMISGEVAGAIVTASRAVALTGELAAAQPADAESEARWAKARRDLGIALAHTDSSRALAELRAAAATFEK